MFLAAGNRGGIIFSCGEPMSEHRSTAARFVLAGLAVAGAVVAALVFLGTATFVQWYLLVGIVMTWLVGAVITSIRTTEPRSSACNTTPTRSPWIQ